MGHPGEDGPVGFNYTGPVELIRCPNDINRVKEGFNPGTWYDNFWFEVGHSSYFNSHALEINGPNTLGLLKRKLSDIRSPDLIVLSCDPSFQMNAWNNNPIIPWAENYRLHRKATWGWGPLLFIDGHVKMERPLTYQRGPDWSFIYND